MKQPTQAINEHQIKALLNGASMLVIPIELDTSRYRFDCLDDDYDEILKCIFYDKKDDDFLVIECPLQIGQTYFVQEDVFRSLMCGGVEQLGIKPCDVIVKDIDKQFMQEHQSRIPSLIPLEIEVKRVQDINWEEITNIMKAVCTCEDNEENRCYFGHDGHFRNWLEKQGISYKENPYIFTIKVKTEIKK
jgi:hypothetical protein